MKKILIVPSIALVSLLAGSSTMRSLETGSATESSEATARAATPAPATASERVESHGKSPSGLPKKGDVGNPYLRLPLEFEANRGQAPARYSFVAHGPTYAVGISSPEIALSLHRSRETAKLMPASYGVKVPDAVDHAQIVLQLLGAGKGSPVLGQDQRPGVSSYFVGNDPSKWQTNVPHFGKVEIAGAYPGIDLVFYGNPQQLEYDFRVAPGADPRMIRLNARGADSASLDKDGDLILGTAAGKVQLKHPDAYQEIAGVRKPVRSDFRLVSGNTVDFELGPYDRDKVLIIDPVLVYAVAIGGSNGNQAIGMDIDAAGNAYVTGNTCSSDFPSTAGNFENIHSNTQLKSCQDAFVIKLDPTASTLIYSDYIGGSGSQTGAHIVVDSSGNAFVAGATGSSDFPTVHNIGPSAPAPCSLAKPSFLCPVGFILKLSADGSQLLFSSLLGGSQSAGAFQVKLNPTTGDLMVLGETNSADFKPAPTTLQATYAGGTCANATPCFNAFLLGLDPATGAYRYGTFFGSAEYTFASGMAIDNGGDIYLTGSVLPPLASSLGPITHTYAPTGATAAGSDAFVARLHPAGTTLTISYLTLVQGELDDAGAGVALDALGNAYVIGSTGSKHLPVTAGAFQSTNTNAGSDDCLWAAAIKPLLPRACGTAFVGKFDSTGALGFLTYLGGSGQNWGEAIALDSLSNIWLTGVTSSNDYPLSIDAYMPVGIAGFGFAFTPFLAQMSSDGTKLPFASTIASNIGQSTDIKIDSNNNVFVTGFASSAPSTPNAYPADPQAFNPIFVQKWGSGAQPGVKLSATQLFFADTALGATSAPQTVTLQNTGSGVLQLAIHVVPDSQTSPFDFVESDTCGASVAPGASCVITATFEPAHLSAACLVDRACSPATHRARIIVTSNAPTGTQSFTVQGSTGLGAAFSIAPNPIVFAPQLAGTTSANTDVFLLSAGDLSLSISSFVLGGPNAADFQVTQTTNSFGKCLDPVQPSTLCQFEVAFSPSASATGTRTATMTLTDNAASSPQVFTMTGTVSSPTAALNVSTAAVDLGPVAIGNSTFGNVTLTNPSSTTDIQVTSLTLASANQADFVAASGSCSPNPPPFTIAHGASCFIQATFTPKAGPSGERVASVTIATNPTVPGLPVIAIQGEAVTNSDPVLSAFVVPNPLDFGSLPIGQSTSSDSHLISVSNSPPLCAGGATTCGAPLTITSITAGLSDYTVSIPPTSYCTVPPLTIPIGGRCNIGVIFTPTAAGDRGSTLTLNSNDPRGPILFPLLGAGLAVPVASLSVTALNFGYSAIGVPSPPLTVSLQNTGLGTLSVSAPTITANYAVASNTCTTPLAAGASCTIGVTFTPPSAGVFPGTLTIPDNDALGAQQLVTLTGTGAAGASLRISQSTVDFGKQVVQTIGPAQTLTIANSGDTTVNFPTNAFRTSVDFILQNTTCGSTLAQGASCTVNLQFKPSQTFFETGSLIITNNARGNPQPIFLTGQGVAAGGTATTTVVTSSVNPSASGQSIVLTATVAGAGGNTPVPTGTVTFLDGSAALGTGTLNGSGLATLSTASLAAGSHAITAAYGSDATYAASTSAVLTQVVNPPVKASTTTTISSSANPSASGQSVVLTATVTGSGTPGPTGMVTFLDGATSLGTGTLNGSAQATFTTASLTAGSHSLTAVYGADTNYSASTSAVLTQVVNPPIMATTTTALTSSANPATAGQSIVLTATVTSTGTPAPTGAVTFLDAATTLGTGALNSSGVATFPIATLTLGSHSLTAQYAGDANNSGSTSGVITQSIVAAPSFSIAITPAALTIARGQKGTATLTVTPVGGFTQAVSFACSGLPKFTTCAFNPATITPAGASATSTLTIATDVATASLDQRNTPQSSARVASAALLLGIGFIATLRRRRYLLAGLGARLLLVLIVLLGGMAATEIAGCGGGSSKKSPTGASTVTVTATAGSQVQTASLTLTIK